MSKLMKLPNIKAYFALLMVYIIWGTTVGFIKIGVDTIPSALLPAVRFLLAGMLLIAFCMLKGEKMPDASDMKKHFIIGALLFFGGNSLVCWAVNYIPTGLGGILVGMTPFWMISLSAWTPPREKVNPMVWLGVVIGFLGMVVLLSPQWSQPQTGSPYFWASVFSILLMSFFWSSGSVYARKQPTQSSTLMSLGWQNLFAGFLLIPIYAVTEGFHRFTPSSASLIALAYLVLFGTIVATSCYYYVLRVMPVSVASTFAYVTPLITVFFGWLFLGEEVTATTMSGAGIILSGVVLVQTLSQRKPKGVVTQPASTIAPEELMDAKKAPVLNGAVL